MKVEKLIQTVNFMYILSKNSIIVVSNEKFNYVNQIKGIGELTNVETIQIDVSNIIDRSLSGSFKLDIVLKIKDTKYNYSKIYKNSEVPNNGIIFLGNIGIIENMSQEEIEINAKITNIS